MSQAGDALHEDAQPRVRWRISSGALSVAILWLLIAATFAVCRTRTGGTFVYPLDDSYIHLALAKNIAEHGIYGVTPYEFTPTSSSIVWPLLLVAVRVVSASDLIPLALNVVFASALALVVDRGLRRDGYGSRGRLVFGVASLLAVPILPVVFIGMEHTLHILAVVLLAQTTVHALAADRERDGAREAKGVPVALGIGLLSLLATAARYESLFLVGVLGLLALYRRRLSLAFALGIGAAVPVVAYALFSLAKGGPILPISVLLKRQEIGVWTFLPTLGRRFIENPHLLALLTLLSLGYVEARARGLWDRRRLMLLVTASVIVLHITFAQTGWFFRYEAYTVALALAALAGPLFEHRARLRERLLPLALVMLPVIVRGAGSLRAVPRASANIYEQQVQMARFAAQYYRGERLVVGDIGAVSYLADVRIVDLIGLGSPAVATLRLRGSLDLAATDRLTRDASIAIVDEGYSPPPQWRRVGLWRTSGNTVCRDDAVAFYAVHPEEEARLTASLREFSPQLPSTIEQSGTYTR